MSEKIKDANPHGAADKIANTILEVVKR